MLGGNYGPNALLLKTYKSKYDDLMFLTDEKHISEWGSSNVFFVFKD